MPYLSSVRLADEFLCYAPSDPYAQFLDLRFIFSEIFYSDTYREDVLAIPEHGTVLDVGANVGLFTIFTKTHKPNARVLAFEPIPNLFDALKKNVSLHNLDDIVLHQEALGAREESDIEFTYYPLAPGLSTRYPDTSNPLLNPHGIPIGSRVTTISSAIAASSDLLDIDLIKIDVEGAELDVLAGIDAHDWARIRSFVIEVDDIDGRLGSVLQILNSHGYAVTKNSHPMVPDHERLFILHAVQG